MIVRLFEVDCHKCGHTYTIRNWGGALEFEANIMNDTLEKWEEENHCPICKTPFNDSLDTIHEPSIGFIHYGVSSCKYLEAARNIELPREETK